MTRYRFPAILGGGEYESTGPVYGAHGMDYQRFRVPDVGWVDIPVPSLTEVEEPLPEEPPVGSVVLAQLVDEDRPWVWEHSSDHSYGAGWYAAGVQLAFEWAELCKVGTPALLVPASVPVTLPWTHETPYGAEVTVTPITGKVNLTSRASGDERLTVTLKPDAARAMAAALLTAADEVMS